MIIYPFGAAAGYFLSSLCFLKIFTFPFDAGRGAFFFDSSTHFILFTSIKILLFPFDAGRGFFFDPLYLLLNFTFSPSTRSGRAGALTFLLLQKSKQKTGAREFHPLANPRTKVGCWTPPLETPKSRWRGRPGRTPRRFAAGASVPLGKAASACALASAAAQIGRASCRERV